MLRCKKIVDESETKMCDALSEEKVAIAREPRSCDGKCSHTNVVRVRRIDARGLWCRVTTRSSTTIHTSAGDYIIYVRTFSIELWSRETQWLPVHYSSRSTRVSCNRKNLRTSAADDRGGSNSPIV